MRPRKKVSKVFEKLTISLRDFTTFLELTRGYIMDRLYATRNSYSPFMGLLPASFAACDAFDGYEPRLSMLILSLTRVKMCVKEYRFESLSIQSHLRTVLKSALGK